VHQFNDIRKPGLSKTMTSNTTVLVSAYTTGAVIQAPACTTGTVIQASARFAIFAIVVNDFIRVTVRHFVYDGVF
jgi:hypothetical protein